MKIFISADIEGVTTTTRWEETGSNNASYHPHAMQMTNEVLVACEGALAAGATKIVVKDAHGSACNIDPFKLPKQVTLIRGWTSSPDLMVQGIDESFDAAMFVGYHSAVGRGGNPMSHTISDNNTRVTINGRLASEFMIYSWAAALYGVPSVFLSGDKMLCEDYADLHPALVTVPVKDGVGGATFCRSVEATLPEIRAGSEQSLRQNLHAAKIVLPDFFEVEVSFIEHKKAEKASYFPDVQKKDVYTVAFIRKDYYEALRTLMWII